MQSQTLIIARLRGCSESPAKRQVTRTTANNRETTPIKGWCTTGVTGSLPNSESSLGQRVLLRGSSKRIVWILVLMAGNSELTEHAMQERVLTPC
jgi:hypothetical protein